MCLARGSAAPGEKAVVLEAGLAVGKRLASKGLDAAAGGFEDRLAGCGVPFHRRAETRVEVGFAGGDDAEFKGAAAAFARLYWIILQKLGEPAAVLVRTAVDDDEPVRRTARANRLGPATLPPTDCRTRPASGVGQTDRRPVHDAEHWPALLDKRDQHRKLAVPGDKLARAVERVDRPEAVTAGRRPLGLA